MPRVRLSSLLLVEERLLEAEYFARRLRRLWGEAFGYELNAFLSAARSVTFLMQKEMAHVPGFPDWWSGKQRELKANPVARFFLGLRNFSQKEGRISLVGNWSDRTGRRWSYRFAGNAAPVPPQLLCRDAGDCCRGHVAKLATIVLGCAEAFPYATCPRRALTPEGVQALGLSIEDIETTLGFPRGWTDIGDRGVESNRLRALREHVDGLDFEALRRLSRWKPNARSSSEDGSTGLSEAIATSLVQQIERLSPQA
jgi:hypothetical protein